MRDVQVVEPVVPVVGAVAIVPAVPVAPRSKYPAPSKRRQWKRHALCATMRESKARSDVKKHRTSAAIEKHFEEEARPEITLCCL